MHALMYLHFPTRNGRRAACLLGAGLAAVSIGLCNQPDFATFSISIAAMDSDTNTNHRNTARYKYTRIVRRDINTSDRVLFPPREASTHVCGTEATSVWSA